MTAKDAGRAGGLLRLALSLLLLGVTLYVVGADALVRRVATLDPGLAAVVVALCLLQFPLLAARWWLFARWLDVPLGYRQALGEYTLSTLLNQLLPLGVMGDVMRIARHSVQVGRERPGELAPGRVLLAVVLERASGQLALWLWVLAVAPGWWRLLPDVARAALLIALVALGLALLWFGRRRLRTGILALLSPRRLLVHLPLSLALVALHVAAFALVAQALGFALPPATAVRVVPPLLVATTLPGFFAGWGVREAAAAGLYALSGLAPAEGAVVSMTWAGLGLLASTPGAWFWLRSSKALAQGNTTSASAR